MRVELSQRAFEAIGSVSVSLARVAKLLHWCPSAMAMGLLTAPDSEAMLPESNSLSTAFQAVQWWFPKALLIASAMGEDEPKEPTKCRCPGVPKGCILIRGLKF